MRLSKELSFSKIDSNFSKNDINFYVDFDLQLVTLINKKAIQSIRQLTLNITANRWTETCCGLHILERPSYFSSMSTILNCSLLESKWPTPGHATFYASKTHNSFILCIVFITNRINLIGCFLFFFICRRIWLALFFLFILYWIQ